MKTLQHYINKISKGQIVESVNRKHVKVIILGREYDIKLNLETLTPYRNGDKEFLLQAQLIIGTEGTNKLMWGCESNMENGKLISSFNKWYWDGVKENNERENQKLEIIGQF